MKGVAILGSTGSIGRQTLDVVRAYRDRFRIVGLAAGRNHDLLQRQIDEFQPRVAARDGEHPPDSPNLSWVEIDTLACHPDVDVVVVGVPGVASLKPTLAAIAAGKDIALASKEVLVIAGELVTAEAARTGSRILPVDSEHSAIFQCIQGERAEDIRRLILTASGGPFRVSTFEEISRVTPEQALAHPTWLMGTKVTIDSATLMNKGLEIIEAHWLYDFPYPKIDVVVHPQSIVHSLVEFADNSVKAQLGYPDMRVAIQYALTYPERWPSAEPASLDLAALGSLTFDTVDAERFPCFRLARQAGVQGETYPAVLQAADEAAVALFLDGRIGLTEIAVRVEAALDAHVPSAHPTLEQLFAADSWARTFVQERQEATAQ